VQARPLLALAPHGQRGFGFGRLHVVTSRLGAFLRLRHRKRATALAEAQTPGMSLTITQKLGSVPAFASMRQS